jgi:CRISPR-associated protein Cmr3
MPPEDHRPVYRVDLQPVEPLLFGDNRPARAGVDHLQQDQDPSPITLYGAIGQFLAERSSSAWPSHLLGDRAADILDPAGDVAELLGYCYCLRAGGTRLLFPRPLHIRCRRAGTGGLEALAPLPLVEVEAGRTSARFRSLLQGSEEVEEVEGEALLSETALEDALCGRRPTSGLFDAGELFRSEPRAGIAVDNLLGTVLEGMLFTRPYRRFRPLDLDPGASGPTGLCAWFETLEVLPPRVDGDPIGFLGGDRRRIRLRFEHLGEERPAVLSRLRLAVESAAEESSGLFLYLLSPAILGEGTIRLPDGSEPVAAAVGKGRLVSGWDQARRQPRELVPLAPAGSVFFFRWPAAAREADARAGVIRQRWLQPLVRRGAAAGFGRTLVGVWR